MKPINVLRISLAIVLSLAALAAARGQEIVHTSDLPAEVLERADLALRERGDEGLRLGDESRLIDSEEGRFFEITVTREGLPAAALVLDEPGEGGFLEFPGAEAIERIDLEAPLMLDTEVVEPVLIRDPQSVPLERIEVIDPDAWRLDDSLATLEAAPTLEPSAFALTAFRFGDGTPGARVTIRQSSRSYGSTLRTSPGMDSSGRHGFETYRVHAWYDRNGNGILDDPSVDSYTPRNSTANRYVFPRQMAVVTRNVGGIDMPDVDLVAGRAFDAIRLSSGGLLRANVMVFVVFSSWHHPDLGSRPQFAVVNLHHDAAKGMVTLVSILAGDLQRQGSPQGEVYVTQFAPSWATDANGKPILSGRFGPKPAAGGVVYSGPWGVLRASVYGEVLYNDPRSGTVMPTGCLIQVDLDVPVDPRG